MFSSIILAEIIFILCNYIKNNTKKDNNKNQTNTDQKILYLNRIMIGLILFNSAEVKFRIFSTIELKIFFDKNIKIINVIYLILFFYIAGYITINIFIFFRNKNQKIKK